MNRSKPFCVSLAVSLLCFLIAVCISAPAAKSQAITATLSGRIIDTSGGSVSKARVTVISAATGFTRTVQSSDTGEYAIPSLPAGEYTVAAEFTGFGKQSKNVILQVGQSAELDFTLTPGGVEEKVEVAVTSELVEPTRTEVSTVITERQIINLPVNGREFINFALLSPSVTVGDTTSGSTDVIVEPVTKLSFAGQNIHYNFIAVDGADDISTASGIQRGTPPQESVQEFRVINTDYSAEFGRATAGIVNIITRSGTNEWHGALYEYFRNDKMDAVNLLQATGAHVLRQNQFGAAIGGPLQKDKTFIYGNYEAQRRGESPFYNSAVLANIKAINEVKAVYGLAPEPNLGTVLRTNDSDNGFARIDHRFSDSENMFLRYFINDGRLLNQSPLNDGFDLPSAFKNNFYRDQSLAGSLASVVNPKLVNELRMQYARRSFDFPTVSTQPHLELSNTFTTGVNRGNPDFYRESRFELVDNVTRTFDRHTVSFGGNFNFVGTTESFPLFYPFEADFPNLDAFLGNDGAAGGIGPQCVSPRALPGSELQRAELEYVGLFGDELRASHPQHRGRHDESHLQRSLYPGQMARHQSTHTQWRDSVGMGDLAVKRAEHTMEERRSTRGLRVQHRHEAQHYRARRLWFVPRHHSGAIACVPGALLWWDDWQVSGATV